MVKVEMVIPTGKTGRTLIVIAFEVTGLLAGHGTLDVSTQVTTSPFTGL